MSFIDTDRSADIQQGNHVKKGMWDFGATLRHRVAEVQCARTSAEVQKLLNLTCFNLHFQVHKCFILISLNWLQF